MDPAPDSELNTALDGSVPRIALVELLDSDGRVVQTLDVLRWPVRIGRALDNELVLHDPHAAAHHATLNIDSHDALVLTAGHSRNGVRLGPHGTRLHLAAGEKTTLPPLIKWRIGQTVLRVRTLDDPLPDEVALVASPEGPPRWATPALVVAALAWLGATLWITNNPDSTWEAYLPPLLAVVAAAVLWASLWGLASKLFTRRFIVGPHLRVVLSYALVATVSELLLGVLAYMFDAAWIARLRGPLAVIIGAAMLAHHLRLVAPAHPRRINAIVAGLAALSLGIGMAFQWQRSDKLLSDTHLSTLPPPAWRLVQAKPPADLIDELHSLEAPLLASAKKAAAKDND